MWKYIENHFSCTCHLPLRLHLVAKHIEKSTEDAVLLLKPAFGHIHNHINIASNLASSSSLWAFPKLPLLSRWSRSDIFIFSAFRDWVSHKPVLLYISLHTVQFLCINVCNHSFLPQVLPGCQLACNLAESTAQQLCARLACFYFERYYVFYWTYHNHLGQC